MRASVLERSSTQERIHERRQTRRVYEVWASLIRGPLPDWRSMQATDLGDDWAWCYAVDWRRSRGFPYFIFLGDQLSHYSNVFLSGARECEMTLLEKATRQMEEVVLDRAPIFSDEDVTLYDGRRVLLRSVILPLADDGETVSHIFGAANGRFV